MLLSGFVASVLKNVVFILGGFQLAASIEIVLDKARFVLKIIMITIAL